MTGSIDKLPVVAEESSSFQKHLFFKLARYIRVIIRCLRLQIFAQATRWKRPSERPKVAVYQNRRVALIYSIVHIVPMSAAITFIALNIATFYCGPVSTTTLTALQFAAKTLEITIQASITAILLSIIRSELLGPTSLPLGSLMAPFHTTRVSYLWSLELWGTITSRDHGGWRRLLLALAMIAAVILTAVVGPSSAVLVIPRPIEYPVRHLLTLLDPVDTILPSKVVLNGSRLPNEDNIREALGQIAFSEVNSAIKMHSTVRTIQSRNAPVTSDQSATLPSSLLAASVAARSGFLSKASLFQPYVSLYCSQNYLLKSADPATTYIDPVRMDPVLTYADFFNMTRAGANASAHSVRTWRGSREPISSQSALVMLTGHGSGVDHKDPPGEEVYEVEACYITASWFQARTNFTVQTAFSSSTGSNAIVSVETDPLSPKITPFRLIEMTPEWGVALADLYTSIPSVSGMSNDTACDLRNATVYAVALAEMATVPGDYNEIWKESEIRASSNDLSEVQRDSIRQYIQKNDLAKKYTYLSFFTNTSWTDPTTLMHLESTQYKQGYGYDTTNVPVKLSLAVLLVYCVTAMTYLIYTLLTGRTGNSWDTVTELFMLGVQSSSPKHLEGINVGIETLNTLREPVSIRVNEIERAELVFANDPGVRARRLRYVSPNKRY